MLIKGDAKVKIKDVLLKLCRQKTWSNEEMMRRVPAWNSDLKTTENCWVVAIGYNAIYNTLRWRSAHKY